MDFIDAVYTLKHNPFKYSEYIYNFYKELEGVEQNLLLAKLIIPFCNHPQLSFLLERVGKNSTLITKFNEPQLFFDINEHISHFKDLTHKSLQSAIINDLIIINTEHLQVEVQQNKKIIEIKEAKNLAKLFSNLKVEDIYTHFRIKNNEVSYL